MARVTTHELEVRGIIGIAVSPQDGQDTEAIMEAAEQALGKAIHI